MGENFDMTTIESGKKGKVRNQEKAIIDIVSVFKTFRTVANLLDVLTEAERRDIPQQGGGHHRQIVPRRAHDATFWLRHPPDCLSFNQGLCS